MTEHRSRSGPAAWIVGLVLMSLWILCAAVLPVVQDEAYYFSWAKHLDLGYFDHPPLVALVSQPALFADGSPLVARLGTLIVAALTILATVRFLRAAGLHGSRLLGVGLMLAFGNVMGLAFGFITTPDTGLMLAWVLALAEAALALRGQTWRWLTSGLAVGLGLWAKYTMLLIGPVFLWALVADLRQARTAGRRPQLATPWPYVGGALAFLVLAPHLRWNAEHDWITLRFQLRHGFATEHMKTGGDTGLPLAEEPLPDGPEVKLAAAFSGLEAAEKKEERKERPYDAALKALNAYTGYYASQLGLWGGAGIALFVALRRRRRLARGGHVPVSEGGLVLDPHVRPLALAAAAVPLLVFGTLSLGLKVEANWSAMYVFGAAALLAPLMSGRGRLLAYGCAGNVALLLVALAHARFGILPTRPHRDRMLAETHGYGPLAAKLATLDGPVFADSYQITAMTTFLAPRLTVRQWPGITRDSEYVRSPAFADLGVDALARRGSFWLVTTNDTPPRLPGFFPLEMAQLRDCKDEGLQVISSQSAFQISNRCRKPIHEWYLLRYGVARRAQVP